MPTRAILALALILVLSTAPQATAQGVMPAPGDVLPPIRGLGADGELQTVDYSASKFTLVNFWATWCEPCKTEMPMLERTHRELGPRGLQVVGVTNEDIDSAELAEFAETMGLSYRLFHISAGSKRVWPGSRGILPNSYLLDTNGRLVRRYVGASKEQITALEADLTAVIAGKPLGPMVLTTDDAVVKGGTEKAPKR